MLSFRFHIISLVAVFLALAIGIIMGSTVIDRALVDTLEDQQQSLRADLDDLSAENSTLRDDLSELRDAGDLLASEGSQRLLRGALADVPVLVVSVRGIDTAALDGFTALLATAGAADQGTLWLTDRLALDDEDAVADLAAILGERGVADDLRAGAIDAIAAAIAAAVEGGDAAAPPADGGPPPGDGTGGEDPGDDPTGAGGVPGDGETADGQTAEPAGDEGTAGGQTAGQPGEGQVEDGADGALGVLVALRDGGFVDYDAPEGGSDDLSDLGVAGTRVALVSGPGADVADEVAAAPLAAALVEGGADGAPVDLLAAEGSPEEGDDADADGEVEPGAPLVALVRDGAAADRLSTVDNLDDFAGRLAAVVALQDLGEGRTGHYGTGPGAQRLVPAPPG